MKNMVLNFQKNHIDLKKIVYFTAENYASFPLNYADHSKQIDKINGYQTQLSQNEQIKFNLIQDDRNFYHDEGTMLMRNRSNQNIQNIGAPSTKV